MIFVNTNPPDPSHLKVLERLPSNVKLLGIGDTPSAFSEETLKTSEIVLCGATAVNNKEALPRLFPLLPSLKWIHSCTAGVNHLVFPALKQSGIPLSNARGVFSRALAEYAMLGCLFFAKGTPRLRSSQAVI